MSNKILIVDDEVHIRTLLEQSLEELEEDYDVELHTAVNGKEGLDSVKSLHPGLVLLDVMMPMMSGYDVCRQIKANPATEHIPVLCVTSAQSPEVRENAQAAGAQGLLIKPFATRELVAQINRHLPSPQSNHAE